MCTSISKGTSRWRAAEQIDTLLALMENVDVQVGTLKTPCAAEDRNNPNAVKVVTNLEGRALYFSRATIPFDRDAAGDCRYYKHLGFYAYRKPALDAFVKWPESELERSERLEQLRFLDNGVSIYVAETPFDTVGVDTEEDLRRVEEILRRERELVTTRAASDLLVIPQRTSRGVPHVCCEHTVRLSLDARGTCLGMPNFSYAETEPASGTMIYRSAQDAFEARRLKPLLSPRPLFCRGHAPADRRMRVEEPLHELVRRALGEVLVGQLLH